MAWGRDEPGCPSLGAPSTSEVPQRSGAACRFWSALVPAMSPHTRLGQAEADGQEPEPPRMQPTVRGEPPRPPASSEAAVVAVVMPVSTGGSCWKTSEILVTGRWWHGEGCWEMPRRHHRATARSHPTLLQRFGLLRCGRGGGGKEPTRHQQGIVAPSARLGTRSATWAQASHWAGPPTPQRGAGR